jgi:hypothetical protein
MSMNRANWNAEVVGGDGNRIPTLVDHLEYAVYTHRCMIRMYRDDIDAGMDQPVFDFHVDNLRKARIALAALYAAGEE